MASDNLVIVVLGSTGNQGRGVLQSLLREVSATWHVRAITRNVGSPAAQELLKTFQTPDERLSLKAGDIYDLASLKDAFSGAHGVFAVTSELSGKIIANEEGMKHELQAGKNIVAAAKTCNVKHFVLSSLPNMKQATSGRFQKIFHMDHKSIIEQWAKDELSAVTCLIPEKVRPMELKSSTSSNLEAENGVVRFCPPIPATKLVEWVDPEHDMGIFAARVFALGVTKTNGKSYFVGGKKLRMEDLASTFARHTGQPAIYDPITIDEWADMASHSVGPGFKEDIRQMMEWFSIAPEEKRCYGALDPADDVALEELGLEASSFEDWLKRSNWAGP
ncbi:hypothetical protein N7447_008424 [Penicillium robsamsonii]|uniref:uncharacterized protein n=1 Tax=Penicillium robsamsonii TaxID=1792511 RepID=UPI0025473C0E|nr:uncharacterized protein N7447_008424 [Penicillium robsamsonii]KAJ5816191.1 hypothetical protein N7447_008424 [Penicillium robsamsonii]